MFTKVCYFYLMYQSDCPHGFIVSKVEKEFYYNSDQLQIAWDKLQLRETFVRGQPFPYKVEFDSSSQDGAFMMGELNIHHGPLLSVHGKITDVTDTFRGLDYFYGSYVLSFRLVRPIKLEFFKKENSIEMKLTSYVRPWFKGFWEFVNNILWKAFPRTLQ